MIFVTIGTTMPFDELFQEIDKLIIQGFFKQDVICQIGNSTYQPQHCEFFRFKENLNKYYQLADFLIIHGGTGSTIDALLSKKPFIAFANKRGVDSHQQQFLTRMEQEYQILWSESCSDLSLLYELALTKKIEPKMEAKSALAKAIIALCY